MLEKGGYYLRMMRGLYDYASRPVPTNPQAVIREQIARREEHFLSMLQAIVYANPSHPFRRMLDLAACTFEDVKASVAKNGLESTLASLQRAGVYLTHDEFKGRTPLIRSGQQIPAGPNAFVNPLVPGRWENPSSGSTGARVPTAQSGAYRVYRDNYDYLINLEFETRSRPRAIMHAILPTPTGIIRSVACGRLGLPFEHWFTAGGSFLGFPHYRFATELLVLEARLFGNRVPMPTYLPESDFTPVAEWLARCRAAGTPGFFVSVVSAASRIACVAADRGLDIRGSRFYVGGEALTSAKRARIEATGSEVFPHYISSELGAVGTSCSHMRTGNCVHLFRDGMAVVEIPRVAPLSQTQVNSLAFTTLLPTTPRFLINYEIFDHGIVEKATCDCHWSRIGFTEQIRDLYSFAKVTGHGTTLTGSDLVHIVEEVLPRRFGGGPGDYQLAEVETGVQTRMRLVVRPGASKHPPGEIHSGFLDALCQIPGGEVTARDWRHAGSVVVEVEEPFTTQAGKVPSLKLLGRERREHSGS